MQEKRKKIKNVSETTHSVIRPLHRHRVCSFFNVGVVIMLFFLGGGGVKVPYP